MLTETGWGVVVDNVCITELEMSTLWSFAEKFADTCHRDTLQFRIYQLRAHNHP